MGSFDFQGWALIANMNCEDCNVGVPALITGTRIETGRTGGQRSGSLQGRRSKGVVLALLI